MQEHPCKSPLRQLQFSRGVLKLAQAGAKARMRKIGIRRDPILHACIKGQDEGRGTHARELRPHENVKLLDAEMALTKQVTGMMSTCGDRLHEASNYNKVGGNQ